MDLLSKNYVIPEYTRRSMTLEFINNLLFMSLLATVMSDLPALGAIIYLNARACLSFVQTVTNYKRKISRQNIYLKIIATIYITLSTLWSLRLGHRSDLMKLFLLAILIAIKENINVYEKLIKKLGLYKNSRRIKTYFIVSAISVATIYFFPFNNLNWKKSIYLITLFFISNLNIKILLDTDFNDKFQEKSLNEKGLFKLPSKNAQVKIWRKYKDISRSIYLICYMILVVVFIYVLSSEQNSFKNIFFFWNLLIPAFYFIEKICLVVFSPNTEYTIAGVIGASLMIVGIVLFRPGAVKNIFLLELVACVLIYLGISLIIKLLKELNNGIEEIVSFFPGDPQNEIDEYFFNREEILKLMGETFLFTILLCSFQNYNRFPAKWIYFILSISTIVFLIKFIFKLFKYPLTNRNIAKLRHYLKYSDQEVKNKKFESYMENLLTADYQAPFLLKIMISIAKPFYKYDILGMEHINYKSNERLVFICNHGSFYGPIATYLNLPLHLRPWSISDLVETKKDAAAYMYKHDKDKWKYLPQKLKKPFAIYILAPIAIWFFKSLEAIPVYRNKPKKLMKTFRDSLEALELYDNLLIFPENPDSPKLPKPGYLEYGIGDFHTGFTMLAPLAYKKSGIALKFLPTYVNKNFKTISIGDAVIFNHEKSYSKEKIRVTNELKESMNLMSNIEISSRGKEGEKTQKASL